MFGGKYRQVFLVSSLIISVLMCVVVVQAQADPVL